RGDFVCLSIRPPGPLGHALRETTVRSRARAPPLPVGSIPGSGSLLTHRWREKDSNPRSPVRETFFSNPLIKWQRAAKNELCDRRNDQVSIERISNAAEILILATRRDPKMSEKRGRGQPKFEPTQDQGSQVKQMKALGIPEDRICKTITNPQTGKPVAPMTLARAFAAELESGATEFHTLVGNFILCAILGKKPAFGDAIKSEQVRM